MKEYRLQVQADDGTPQGAVFLGYVAPVSPQSAGRLPLADNQPVTHILRCDANPELAKNARLVDVDGGSEWTIADQLDTTGLSGVHWGLWR